MPQKTILITGVGPNGIGRALATEFQLRGHRVFATGLNETLLAPLRDQGLETTVLDVKSSDSVDAAVAHVSKLTEGRGLDMLINNAGVVHVMPFADTAAADARHVFDVNVLGVFVVTQAFLPLLLEAAKRLRDEGGGQQSVIANLGSINSVFRPPFFAVYNASKAAVEVLGATLRRELAPLGVRVVTLKTGSVKTDLFANAPETKLPEGSLYAPIRAEIESRKMLEGSQMIEADVYARKVADELLKPKVSSVIWAGGLVWFAWLLSWFGLEDRMDYQFIKGSGLDKIRLP